MTRTPRLSHGLLLSLFLAACSPSSSAPLTAADSSAIADDLRDRVRKAYDLGQTEPPPVERFMSLYPAQEKVVSATAGRITTTRDSLEASIAAFWTGVGQFMVRPDWRWDAMLVDVLSRDAAVMTTSYAVPHYTDRGQAHVIGGVWTAVWRRGLGGWHITHEHLSDMPRVLAERLEAGMADSAGTDHSHATPPPPK